ncbi:MAG: hypothetical protein ABGW98_06725 [Myxococcales bacterium]
MGTDGRFPRVASAADVQQRVVEVNVADDDDDDDDILCDEQPTDYKTYIEKFQGAVKFE